MANAKHVVYLLAKKDPLAEQNSNVAKVLPMSKLPMPGSSKLLIPGSSKLPLPGASSSIKQTSTITKPVKRKSNHNEHASKRAKFECDSANVSVLAAAPNFELPPVAKPVARSTTTRAGAGVARKPPSKAAPLKSVGSNLNVTKLPNATAALGANGNGTKPQNKPGETKSFTFKVPQAVPSTSQASSKPAAAAPPAGVGKGKRPAWDTKGRLQDMEETMSRHLENNSSLQQQILLSNERIALLESMNQQLSGTVQQKEQQTTVATTEICLLQRRLKEAEEELDIERTKFRRQLDDLEFSRSTLARQKATLESELTASREEVAGLKTTVATMSASQAGIESELSSTKIRLASAESLCRDRATEIVSLKQTIVEHLNTIDEANTKLRAEEGIRRKLHNTILELKGNIRVFGRIRPLLGDELLGSNGEIAHMHFPDNDHKILELERLGDVNPNESVAAFRKGTSNKYEFSFDRVFDPSSSQDEVFEEISQLVQSALDGYNVCIFAYGQTGSGKTYTMEGVRGMSGDQRGIIPRSVEQVFQTSRDLLEKGWAYTFEVSFLEIYNETIKDLIGNGDLKHEIRLVGPNSTETYVTDLTTISVTSIEQVNDLLLRASHSRSVAETKCNERSSRSHSVFRMKISGSNSLTSESCSGMLNLIDLAGSERLKESGSQGLRLKETQSINKSLANLGNVIMALANKEQHVPYRNSKLTHLLQNCLGGSSKMLMFVNVSPKEECFQETLNSLRFATKVNETNIGTAQKKVK